MTEIGCSFFVLSHCHFECSMGYKFTCFIPIHLTSANCNHFDVTSIHCCCCCCSCVFFTTSIVNISIANTSSLRRKTNEPDIILAKHKFNSISLLNIHFPVYLCIHFACSFTWCMHCITLVFHSLSFCFALLGCFLSPEYIKQPMNIYCPTHGHWRWCVCVFL